MTINTAPRPAADYGDEDHAASHHADTATPHESDIPWVYTLIVRRSSDGMYTAQVDSHPAQGRSAVSANAAVVDLMNRIGGDVFHV